MQDYWEADRKALGIVLRVMSDEMPTEPQRLLAVLVRSMVDEHLGQGADPAGTTLSAVIDMLNRKQREDADLMLKYDQITPADGHSRAKRLVHRNKAQMQQLLLDIISGCVEMVQREPQMHAEDARREATTVTSQIQKRQPPNQSPPYARLRLAGVRG